MWASEGVPLTLFPLSANADLETVKKLSVIAGYKARMESEPHETLMENHRGLTSFLWVQLEFSRVILPPCSVTSLGCKWMKELSIANWGINNPVTMGFFAFLISWCFWYFSLMSEKSSLFYWLLVRYCMFSFLLSHPVLGRGNYL